MRSELRRILYWDIGIPRPPIEIELHPTDNDNLKGVGCWKRRERDIDPAEIPGDILVKIAEEGCKMGVKRWIISGSGEPLLLKEKVIELMKTIKDNHRYGELRTNGTMFTGSLVSDIVEMGWERISICLLSPDRDKNDEIAGIPGAFSRVLEGLDMFHELKEELGRTLPALYIHMPLLSDTFNEVSDMLKFAKRKDIRGVVIEPQHQLSVTTNGRYVLDEEEKRNYQNMVPWLHSLSRSLRISLETRALDHPEEASKSNSNEIEARKEKAESEKLIVTGELDPERLYCLEPFLKMVIRPSGGFGPCTVSWYDKEDKDHVPMESFRKKSLEDIWYGNFFSFLRENAKTGKPGSYCERCTPHLRQRQISLIKSLRLKREHFVDRAVKQFMTGIEEKNEDIKERLGRIQEFKEEIEEKKEKLRNMRRYHIELEKIRSSKLYKILRFLRLIRPI